MGFIADIFTGNKAVKAQEKAADKSIAASTDATNKTLALQKEMFDRVWGGTQVQRDAGDAATRQMAALMGLDLGSSAAPNVPGATTGGAAQPGARPVPGVNDWRGGLTPLTQDADAGALAGNALSGTQGAPAMSGQGLAAGGENALATDPTAWLRSTPGYQFNLDEGMRALNTGLASQGRLFSGDAGREAVRYGQNYGDRIYGDQWNRLAGIAGAGQTAQSQGAQAGTNYANSSGNALMRNADNLSSSYQNKGNAQSGFWGDMGGLFGSDAVMRMAGTFMKGGF